MFRKSGVELSTELYEKAGNVIPGWTQLISRRASNAAAGVSPVYATRAKGSRFTDVDGNEYVDWVNALTAIILGHADEVVDDAVKNQINLGSIHSVNSPMEIELANELIETIPSAEMVRYTKGGGEACAMAVRIARGTTGREKILFSGYHGWHDWYQSANFLVDPESGDYPFAGIEPIGVPKALAGTALPFVHGDLQKLEDLLIENRGQVAAIMMEPMRTDLPAPGYLEGVKQLAKSHNAALIFDEVSCGWRASIGGIQEYLGVIPDMTIHAKAMSNGYPMGVVLGSKEIMEPASRMFISSSYWSDNIGLIASITTIRELKNRNSAVRFKEIGEGLRSALEDAISSTGVAAHVTGIHTNPTIIFDVPDPDLAPKIQTLFIQEMALRGIHCAMGFTATLAHTTEDIQVTAKAAAESFEVVMSGLEGDIENLLIADVKKDPFRRLVR